MKALISGQIETAILIEDNVFSSITLDNPDLEREITNWDISRMFANATDVILIDNTNKKQ